MKTYIGVNWEESTVEILATLDEVYGALQTATDENEEITFYEVNASNHSVNEVGTNGVDKYPIYKPEFEPESHWEDDVEEEEVNDADVPDTGEEE